MDADRFTKVFDLATSGFKDWQFAAFGLIFIAIGMVFFFAPTVIRRLGIPFINFRSKRLTVFRYGFLGFGLLWTAAAFLTTYGTYRHHRDLVDRNACRIIEGPVTDFVPMPFTGHAEEMFSVAGVRFKYSDYEATDAFNSTSSHGGPVSQDSYVRICYDPSDNAILRLEIRDFHGMAKDYARGDSLFGDFQLEGSNGPSSPMPAIDRAAWSWLGNIWFALWVLDFILILGMYIPYLRTFWRIKAFSLANVPVPSWFARGSNVKLRNSLARWDAAGAAIWMRPRGFNIFRVQSSVAKLNIDRQHDVITGWEIRLSSGMPVIFVFFFLSAFLMFSAAMPGGREMAGLFVGFAAFVFLLSFYFARSRLVARMQILVQDVLNEFASTSD